MISEFGRDLLGAYSRPSKLLPLTLAWLIFGVLGASLLLGEENVAVHQGGKPSARRALLVGIDRYTPPPGAALADRGWSDLKGSVNDALALRTMLVERFGFPTQGMRLLLDGDATRENILKGLQEHLLAPAQQGDELVFYFAGHGSRVKNTLSSEADQLDESRVPADAARGARDLRDKELRPLLNAMLDRGARVTVIFDSCHSGSGARGPLRSARARSLAPDPRSLAVKDPPGLAPEDRGALILTATGDEGNAWETVGPDEKAHGAFTLALLEVLRNAGDDETAEEVFERARVRLLSTVGWQHPVLAGSVERRSTTLFGTGGRGDQRTAVPISKVFEDGTFQLAGGWVHGLHPKSELRHVATQRSVEITALEGLGGSRARPLGKGSKQFEVGDLLVLEKWVVPPEATLRVQLPLYEGSLSALRRLASKLTTAEVQWVIDPVATPPTHIVTYSSGTWHLADAYGRTDLGRSETLSASRLLAALGPAANKAKVFLQLPVPTALANPLALGAGTENSAIELVEDKVDYSLVGRWVKGSVSYGWVRTTGIRQSHSSKGNIASALPARTDFIAATQPDLSKTLTQAAVDLGLIRSWMRLESPERGVFPYRLALRRGKGNPLRHGGQLHADDIYDLLLVADPQRAQKSFERRYVYGLLIDSFGKTSLFFPQSLRGNVENLFPAEHHGGIVPEIVLGRSLIAEPFGTDIYLLLTTSEPLPTPRALGREGVRQRGPCVSPSALQCLLERHGIGQRNGAMVTPMGWSVERLLFESVEAVVATP